jgi:Methane oxygenase PmoA
MKTSFISLLWLVTSLAVATTWAAEIKVVDQDAIIRVTADEKAIFEYHKQPGPVPEGVPSVFARSAYLHPVYTPGGRLVTGNFPADHRWHRGIWMAWTKTEFGEAHPDFWNLGKGEGQDKSGEKLLSEIRFTELAKLEANRFTTKHRWLDHSTGKERPVLDETWVVSAEQKSLAGVLINIIDLTSTQTCASETALKLPRYHYGGLGVRGHAEWNPGDAVVMLTSEGHNRRTGDATKARWVYIGGKVDGGMAGMAILIHPGNFRFPQPLRLNPKNPQLSVAPSQDGDWSIEPGQPYQSRYRFLVFDGEPDARWIEAQWLDYGK